MTATLLRPLSSIHVSQHQIARQGLIPNTSIQHKPLLIYRGAFNPTTLTPDAIEEHITSVGVFAPQWRYTMYRQTHFHSTTHELLVVFRGKAKLCFGADVTSSQSNEDESVVAEVKKGDAILVPAGVGHRLLEEMDSDEGEGFEMIGSYPEGSEKWDMCYGKKGKQEEGVDQRIEKLGWVERDPLYGEEGPAGRV
ncbi:RmlC-like cupin domain-containing protein [Cristinia sonorae]|uniref:RmlC-like cupin domain-containing protein n=1 Tax=Cristinia sonorae TaxID=1940300 RepID=A0A8K0UG52_9AGAR|nr:RmlC-like cupin domain-containing protein [Cristinia sonorae]